MSDGLTTRSLPLGNITLTMDDVIRLYRILRDRVAEAAEIELRTYVKPDHVSLEEFEQFKQSVRDCYKIQIVVGGQDGEQIVHDDETIFYSKNLPAQIAYVFMTSMTLYRALRNNQNPRNGFEMRLDFSKPPLLDWQTPVSSPTPNNSNLTIIGDDFWVRAVAHSVLERLASHSNGRRRVLHKPFVYDLGLFLVAVPLAFLVARRASPILNDFLANSHSVVQGAVYVYLFLFVLLLYRFVFSYAKWAFPTVELLYGDNAPHKHRMVWGTLVLGIIGTAIYDLVV